MPATPAHTNRLSKESSPYLLQHQHNPVDWWAWGQEAFAEARRTGRPVFLSVGYSTCYWCHVMERQCFENEAVAAVMNEACVNIKVDREERPDVDQLYMTAVQVMTRQGGWPMSVFLLPDGRPFYGGTYFPPQDAHGRPGFPTLVTALAEAVRDRPAEVAKTADELLEILENLADPLPAQETLNLALESIDVYVDRSTAGYDPVNGGFGQAPKFPQETLLELLLHWLPLGRSGHATVARQLRHTLDAMAAGGIRDQLGGGFHRYSTDGQWLVPHFEIMLYDNALLAWVYAEAARQFNEPQYAAVARGVCDFVLRELTSPDGAFYTAWDAEVDHQEGKNYLWTPAEVEVVLGKDDAATFNAVYGLDRGFNFADPHGASRVPDRNVLFLAGTPERAASAHLTRLREALLAERQTRKKPLLDTKIITAWNALMIRGLARAGVALGEPAYTAAAQKAADWLLVAHAAPDGGLYRTSRDATAKISAFLDDYAYLAQALLELAEATADAAATARYRNAAANLARQIGERFGDQNSAGLFFDDAAHSDLIVRQKVAADSPLPSGNAAAAIVYHGLGDTDRSAAIVRHFAQQMNHHAESMSSTVQATLNLLLAAGPMTVEPDPARIERESLAQQAEAAVEVEGEWISDHELTLTLKIAAGFHLHAPAGPGDRAGPGDVAATADESPGATASTATAADTRTAGSTPTSTPSSTPGSTPPPATVATGVTPTRLGFADAWANRVSGLTMPPPASRQFAYTDAPAEVYEGVVEISITLLKPMQPDEALECTLDYQPCTDSACLPGVRRGFRIGWKSNL